MTAGHSRHLAALAALERYCADQTHHERVEFWRGFHGRGFVAAVKALRRSSENSGFYDLLLAETQPEGPKQGYQISEYLALRMITAARKDARNYDTIQRVIRINVRTQVPLPEALRNNFYQTSLGVEVRPSMRGTRVDASPARNILIAQIVISAEEAGIPTGRNVASSSVCALSLACECFRKGGWFLEYSTIDNVMRAQRGQTLRKMAAALDWAAFKYAHEE